jgi:hypothetical protein
LTIPRNPDANPIAILVPHCAPRPQQGSQSEFQSATASCKDGIPPNDGDDNGDEIYDDLMQQLPEPKQYCRIELVRPQW